MNTNANTLLQESARGHPGMCVVSNSCMYPWLFKRCDCGLVEEDDIDDKTINITINHKGGGGGGEERYGSVEGEKTGGRGGDRHCGSSRRS